jgi:hypothetical protein
MLRQTCLLLPDQAAGDSVAALLRWYGESIDEHLTIRITVWLLGSKFAQKVLVSAMPNSGKGNGQEIETFWSRSCLFSVLQYSDMGVVAEVSYLLQIAVSALHCIALQRGRDWNSSCLHPRSKSALSPKHL